MDNKFVLATFLALSLLIAGTSGWGEEVSVPAVPPVVIQTVPQAGSTGVDPKLPEVRVSFSKDMMDQGWSWVMLSKETFPEMAGKPRFLKDKRTCVLPVKLAPGKTYGMWINDTMFVNFKDTHGRSAVPYLLVFETKK